MTEEKNINKELEQHGFEVRRVDRKASKIFKQLVALVEPIVKDGYTFTFKTLNCRVYIVITGANNFFRSTLHDSPPTTFDSVSEAKQWVNDCDLKNLKPTIWQNRPLKRG